RVGTCQTPRRGLCSIAGRPGIGFVPDWGRWVSSRHYEHCMAERAGRAIVTWAWPNIGLEPTRLRPGVRPHTQFRNSHPEDRTMTKYLISFPGSVMDISDEDMAAVGEAAHAVIREAKDAGVYVFGGGINEDVAPLMVAADGTVTNETYPQTKEFDGGF